jgi:hypothetical protein
MKQAKKLFNLLKRAYKAWISMVRNPEECAAYSGIA